MCGFTTIIKRTVIYYFLFAVYITVLNFFEISCPILHITGIKCPTCGVSRALLAAFRLDFKSYLHHNPFAIPLVVAVWIMINYKNFKHKTILKSIAIAVVGVNFVFYVLNLIL